MGRAVYGSGGRNPNVAKVTDGELHVRAKVTATVPASTTIVAPLPLPVDVAAQSVGNINIDISEQSLPTVDVNVVSPDPLPVEIAAQSITLEVTVTETRRSFSESTRGAPIDIGQGVGNEIVIHETPVDETDQLTLFLSNVDGPSTIVDVHIADTTVPIEVFVPAGETVLALDGIPMESTAVIAEELEANTQNATSTVRAFGYVVRQ